MSVSSMRVIFGSQTIKAFVTAPRNVKVLGIIRLDMEFGLLAIDEQGQYIRVNGSQVVVLNQDEVRAAINKARLTSRTDPFEEIALQNPSIMVPLMPKVVVRKRRTISPLAPMRSNPPALFGVAA